MTKHTSLAIALTVTTFLSAPAIAVSLTPTLDALKSEAGTVLPSINQTYELSELSGDLPAGAVKVEIGDKDYYFTPSGDHAGLLTTLARTSAGMLQESSDGLFALDGKKYGFNVASIPNSVFSYSDGSESDYNFTMSEADADGKLTTKYYKMNLKPKAFTTSKNISWTEIGEDQKDADDVVKMKLSNDWAKYFKYTYTKPEGRTVYNTKPTSLTSPDIDADFIGIGSSSSRNHGGAISNGGATVGNITGDFIGNYVLCPSCSGGAIYNNGTINGITGNFIGNYAYENSKGGAIYNAGTIGDITGNFIGNYAEDDYSGGAIYNTGTINNITGNYIGNYMNRYSGGGTTASASVIHNGGTINNITGDFIGNHSANAVIINYTSNKNKSVIKSINGNFINNVNYGSGSVIDVSYSYSDTHTANNFNSSIGDITGNFINNTGRAIRNSRASLSNISGNFINNNSSGSGGAIHAIGGRIGNINGNFIDNHAEGRGGAIYGTFAFFYTFIGDINGNFIGNYATSSDAAEGGGIYIATNSVIGDITSDFVNNYVSATENGNSSGGAIFNGATINSVTGNFIGNSATAVSGNASGGAISNDKTQASWVSLGKIKGDFVNNHAESVNGKAQGGSVYNTEYLHSNADFIGNYAKSTDGDAHGGAVYTLKNSGTTSLPNNLMYLVTVRYGDQELKTYSLPNSQDNMQIISAQLTLDDAEAFEQLKQQNQQGKDMMDILLSVPANELTIESYVDLMIRIGEIPEDQKDQIMAEMDQYSPEEKEQMLAEVRQEMTKEQEQIKTLQAAIDNAEPINNVLVVAQQGSNFTNSSFRNNRVESVNGEASGGAIYGSGIEITADNYTSIFDGNTANGKNNAIYVLNKSEKVTEDLDQKLSADFHNKFSQGEADWNAKAAAIDVKFSTVNDGIILLNDGIDGEKGYSIGFKGDKGIEEKTLRTPQYVKLNNSLANAGNVYVNSTTLMLGNGTYGKGEIVSDHTALSLDNGVFDIANGYQEVVKLKGYSAANSYLHMDVDVENLSADKLMVNGNVEGQTKLVLYPTSDKDIQGESIVFASSENDTAGNKDSFKVWRVYRSPYLFEVKHTVVGENANQWELVMGEEENEYAGVEPNQPDVPDVPDVPTPPTPDKPDVPVKTQPSVDYRKVAPEVIAYQGLPVAALEQTKGMVGNIGGQINRTDADHSLWANAVYQTSENEALVNVDADVWGLEAGGDLQHDLNNKLGLFLSYRKGNYDMNGDGKHHYSTIGSEIDIDSYLAGLYYRYDRNNWWTFATVYGGIQRVDLKTKDGIKSDTDGTEFGGSVELGYDYALNKTVYLTPSVGAFYTQVDYDDATDSAGKVAKYNTLRQLELEAGVKLTKAFVMDEGYANLYVKPSVVQTVTDGDEVRITGLGKVNTLDDQTLGRIEIGGRYGFTEQLSAYGWANHTFGDDYKASTFGLGLSYSW